MSLRTLHRRVREVACWRRPRLVAKGDPDRDQILAGLHQQINDLPTGAVLLAEDETHINLLPWVRATWIPKGQRQQVMTPGKNRRRTIFGAVDLATGRFLYQVTHKAVSASFTAFCEQPRPPGARLLPPAHHRADAGDRRAAQLTLATSPLRAELQGGRLAERDHLRKAAGEVVCVE
jgi:DDE superfamily endonuclease